MSKAKKEKREAARKAKEAELAKEIERETGERITEQQASTLAAAIDEAVAEAKAGGKGDVAEADFAEQAAVAEVEADNAKSNSVVAVRFKQRYLDKAREAGIKGKAAKRSNWDWLAQKIAECCLSSKHKINISEFIALMDANGVDHSRWTNRNKGWEGRFRMTGRVALQRIVADTGVLKLVDGSEAVPPAEWREKYKTKA